jgi:hypothetical protein
MLNNAATALESREVIERGGEIAQSRVDRFLVGHWGDVTDPLDTMWVHPDGTPYAHDEASVPRGEESQSRSVDAEFEEGGRFDAWAD